MTPSLYALRRRTSIRCLCHQRRKQLQEQYLHTFACARCVYLSHRTSITDVTQHHPQSKHQCTYGGLLIAAVQYTLSQEVTNLTIVRSQVPKILKAIPQTRVQEMQRNLAKIWHRWYCTRGATPVASSHHLAVATHCVATAAETCVRCVQRQTCSVSMHAPLHVYHLPPSVFRHQVLC